MEIQANTWDNKGANKDGSRGAINTLGSLTYRITIKE